MIFCLKKTIDADRSLAGSALSPPVNGIKLQFADKVSRSSVSPVGIGLLKRYCIFIPLCRILNSHLCYCTIRNEIHAVFSLIHFFKNKICFNSALRGAALPEPQVSLPDTARYPFQDSFHTPLHLHTQDLRKASIPYSWKHSQHTCASKPCRKEHPLHGDREHVDPQHHQNEVLGGDTRGSSITSQPGKDRVLLRAQERLPRCRTAAMLCQGSGWDMDVLAGLCSFYCLRVHTGLFCLFFPLFLPLQDTDWIHVPKSSYSSWVCRRRWREQGCQGTLMRTASVLMVQLRVT